MNAIELKNGYVYYYGNPAGYVDRDQGAAVVDNLFRGAELENWLAKRNLTPRWTDGVYDRLASGAPAQAGEPAAPLKSCRIWQLKPDVDVMMKFVGYDEVVERFGEPDSSNYDLAYDGQIDSYDQEDIWTKFSPPLPPGFSGRHPIAKSDVVELYDHAGSEFYYVDTRFRQITFDGREQAQAPGMTMSM